jgi:hypothetical protein
LVSISVPSFSAWVYVVRTRVPSCRLVNRAMRSCYILNLRQKDDIPCAEADKIRHAPSNKACASRIFLCERARVRTCILVSIQCYVFLYSALCIQLNVNTR